MLKSPDRTAHLRRLGSSRRRRWGHPRKSDPLVFSRSKKGRGSLLVEVELAPTASDFPSAVCTMSHAAAGLPLRSGLLEEPRAALGEAHLSARLVLDPPQLHAPTPRGAPDGSAACAPAPATA